MTDTAENIESENDAVAPENADELAALAAHAEELEPETAANDETAGVPAEVRGPRPETVATIQMLLGPLASTLAPNWGISDGEIEQLSTVYAALADKYMPDGIEMGPEMSAALVTMTIIAPRLHIPRNNAEAAKRSQRQGKADARQQAEAARKAAEKQPAAANESAFDLAAAESEIRGTEIKGTPA